MTSHCHFVLPSSTLHPVFQKARSKLLEGAMKQISNKLKYFENSEHGGAKPKTKQPANAAQQLVKLHDLDLLNHPLLKFPPVYLQEKGIVWTLEGDREIRISLQNCDSPFSPHARV